MKQQIRSFIFERFQIVVFRGDHGFDRFLADLLCDLVQAFGEEL